MGITKLTLGHSADKEVNGVVLLLAFCLGSRWASQSLDDMRDH